MRCGSSRNVWLCQVGPAQVPSTLAGLSGGAGHSQGCAGHRPLAKDPPQMQKNKTRMGLICVPPGPTPAGPISRRSAPLSCVSSRPWASLARAHQVPEDEACPASRTFPLHARL